ncbi:hypothetical protein R3P38DRAFT_2866207 [Favolaschia claudopus]|uniref:F-box domain-containing protein n=1 Tax=Favolaschia claudopus TaxID=2862362 RepID=A0AAW0DIC0_9AGAR
MQSPRTPLHIPTSPTNQGPKSPLSGLFRRARGFSFISGSRRSGSNSGGESGQNSLPAELWLKIFAHIPLYLLPHVTLTCRTFRFLAQPLMFTVISTHPARDQSHSHSMTSSSSRYHKRVAERLELFFSPRIRPVVTHCKVSPPSATSDDGEDDDLIDYIFTVLPKLPNLRVLSCRHVRLTPARLHIIHSLSSLSGLTLDSCYGQMSDFPAAESFSLKEVTFKHSASQHKSQMPLGPTNLFLSPSHLEHLHATTVHVLSSLSHSPEAFSSLRTLDLPVECVASEDFIPAVMRCPAVEHLVLRTAPKSTSLPSPHFSGLPDQVLPRLHSFTGPHHFAALFLRGRRVVDGHGLTVHIPHPTRPTSLLPSLTKLSHRSLHSLTCSLSTPGLSSVLSLIQSLHATFPLLATLCIPQPALSTNDMKTLLNELSSHAGVRELTLRVEGRDKFGLWIPPEESEKDAMGCFGKVCRALGKTYPGIERVTFLHGSERPAEDIGEGSGGGEGEGEGRGLSVSWVKSKESGLF